MTMIKARCIAFPFLVAQAPGCSKCQFLKHFVYSFLYLSKCCVKFVWLLGTVCIYNHIPSIDSFMGALCSKSTTNKLFT